MEVIVKKISKKSLFRLLFIGFIFGIGTFSILCGVAALFGAETVKWNGVARTGLEGLVYGVLMAPFLAVIFSCVMWCFLAFGLWIFSLFGTLNIAYTEVSPSEQENV
jgi:hypothetical protein